MDLWLEIASLCGLFLCDESGAWYMMSRISFHDMTCRIPFRIDIFFIGMLMCVLLCKHDIACVLSGE